MAGAGTQKSFSDSLHGLLGQVGQLLASPDADVDFVMHLRDTLLERLHGGPQQGPPQGPPGGPPGATPPGGPGGPSAGGLPPPPAVSPPGGSAGGLSRGPTPGMDMSGAVPELQRIMAGS